MSRNKKNAVAKKKNIKILVAILAIIAVIILVAVFITGNKTVESYAKDKSEVITDFEKNFDKNNTKFKYDENKIIIENRITNAMSSEDIDSFKEALKSKSDQLNDEMNPIIKKLKKDLELEDICIEITYYDEDDDKIVTKEYK